MTKVSEIMGFIAAHMGFLWEGARYQIVESSVSTVNGGSSYLDVASDILRMRFTLDKGQLLLSFRRTGGATDEWFSVDLIRRWLTGKKESSSLLDASYAAFVGGNLRAIEELFSDTSWPMVQAGLKDLKRQRADELFGRVGSFE